MSTYKKLLKKEDKSTIHCGFPWQFQLIMPKITKITRICPAQLHCAKFNSSRRAAVTICGASAPCKLTISSLLFARWHQFWHVGYLRHQQQVDLWHFDLESGFHFRCDMGYLCANSSLPRPLCSWVRPDARDRHTDRCQTKASLNASTVCGHMHKKRATYFYDVWQKWTKFHKFSLLNSERISGKSRN